MALTKAPSFTFSKEGIFYFTRRVPRDLERHYSSRRIAYSLRTRSAKMAAARARRAADQLDEYWYHLRSRAAGVPGKHLLREPKAGKVEAERPKRSVSTPSVRLTEAVSIYLSLKGKGRPKTFPRAAERACGYVIKSCGNKPLEAYTKADANAFRDALVARGLAGSSMTRVFGTVRSVINFAASEQGLSLRNPFVGVYYDREAGVSEREPVPVPTLRLVQAECRKIDDDLRWLVALVSDTGMRLAEAAGLAIDDFQREDDGALFVHVRPHPWRRLKTRGSERKVPLEGEALWAAQRILEQRNACPFAFPRYNKSPATNANSASAALNKWLKGCLSVEGTMHGFRHSMRDRLRAAECPADIVDQIGGWQTDGIGQGYGAGYPFVPRQHPWDI